MISQLFFREKSKIVWYAGIRKGTNSKSFREEYFRRSFFKKGALIKDAHSK